MPIIIDGNEDLLLFDVSTDVCLSCHATSNGSVLGPDPLNPPPEIGAGNFTFLLEDNINDASSGLTNPISGSHAGHSVISNSMGIYSDPDYITAPGGTYPSDQLTCTSCHDPHGNQNFRMLRSTGQPDASGFVFTYPAPLAEGLTFDQQEQLSNHTAYQSGWTDWCSNCHEQVHRDGYPVFEHPFDGIMTASDQNSYNQYNGSDDPLGGTYATAYLPQVTLEDPAMTTTATYGAGSSSRLSCMSCHRAHATSAPKNLRWDPNVRNLNQDGAVSGSYPIPSPYISTSQQQLCVKCHYQDIGNHGSGRACMDCHRTR